MHNPVQPDEHTTLLLRQTQIISLGNVKERHATRCCPERTGRDSPRGSAVPPRTEAGLLGSKHVVSGGPAINGWSQSASRLKPASHRWRALERPCAVRLTLDRQNRRLRYRLTGQPPHHHEHRKAAATTWGGIIPSCIEVCSMMVFKQRSVLPRANECALLAPDNARDPAYLVAEVLFSK